MIIEIPKEKEAEILAWFDAQPKNEDGGVTLDVGTSFPPELIGLNREQIATVPKVKIGARVSQAMLDRLKGLWDEKETSN